MDLILWRHAEAQEPADGTNDMDRPLTPRGEKQAARMAGRLDRQLPEGTRVWVSPARRTEQTALALARKYKLRPELAPDCTVAQLLDVAQWPNAKSAVVIVGHQPVLGQTIAHLLGLSEGECAVRKGAVWWLRSRERGTHEQTVIVSVQSPEIL